MARRICAQNLSSQHHREVACSSGKEKDDGKHLQHVNREQSQGIPDFCHPTGTKCHRTREMAVNEVVIWGHRHPHSHHPPQACEELPLHQLHFGQFKALGESSSQEYARPQCAVNVSVNDREEVESLFFDKQNKNVNRPLPPEEHSSYRVTCGSQKPQVSNSHSNAAKTENTHQQTDQKRSVWSLS